MRIVNFLLLMVLFVARTAHACSPGDGDRASNAIDGAKVIAIVRIESLALQDISLDPLIVPYVNAKIRTVELLKGDAQNNFHIRFIADSCGGVDLRIGGYYLVLFDRLVPEYEIKKDDERIFALAGEYSESEFELVKPESPLLDSIREYVASGKLPEEKLLWAYHDKTRWKE